MSHYKALASLFLLVFLTHALSPIATSSDSRWTVPLALSLLTERNTDLNEFDADMRAHRFLGIQCVTAQKAVVAPNAELGCPAGSRAYYAFPIATSVVAAPVLLAADLCLRLLGPAVTHLAGSRLTPAMRLFFERRYTECFALTELVLASFLIAAATVFVFLTTRLYLSQGPSVLAALLFAYATPAYSIGSRALWQHGPEMLMLSAGLYALCLGQARPAALRWSGPPLALAFFVRPTAGIFLALTAIYIWRRHRPQAAAWTLLVILTAAPFVALNLSIYGLPFQPYFVRQQFLAPSLRNLPGIVSALAGHWLSPSRGLLIFSPVLGFSLAGVVLALRRRWCAPLSMYLAAGLLFHWITISLYADWPAGHCYGPRYFSDVIPILVLFLIPVLNYPRKPAALVATFWLVTLWSGFVHYRGAAHWDVYRWNGEKGGPTPAHAWDWNDPQFLRGLL